MKRRLTRKNLETIMKAIASALLALFFLAGVAAPASADPTTIRQLDKEGRGGHHN
jgi:hypothetical protein